LAEKGCLVDILVNLGVPVNSEGKDDLGLLKNELLKELKQDSTSQDGEDTSNIKIDLNNTVMELKDENALQQEKNLVANIERFVTRIRMVAH